MRWLDYLRYAVGALRRIMLRSLLTLGGVAIGISAVVLLVGFGVQTQRTLDREITKQAELRVYDHVASSFAQRFEGMAFPVNKAEFDQLHSRFKDFLEMQAIRVGLARPPVAAPSAQAAPGSKSSVTLWILIAILVLAIAGGLVYFFGFYQS